MLLGVISALLECDATGVGHRERGELPLERLYRCLRSPVVRCQQHQQASDSRYALHRLPSLLLQRGPILCGTYLASVTVRVCWPVVATTR
jgi:hypothetical protein